MLVQQVVRMNARLEEAEYWAKMLGRGMLISGQDAGQRNSNIGPACWAENANIGPAFWAEEC